MPDTLEALHHRIDELTDADGDFAVVCPLSGKRPVPVRGKSFASAEDAETAVDLVVEYRHLLRDVDPHLENIPIVACERDADPLSLDRSDTRQNRDDPRRIGDDARRNRDRDRRNRDRYRRAAGGRTNARQSVRSVTLSGDGDEAWLRIDGAPLVRFREDGELLDDAAVERQLDSKL